MTSADNYTLPINPELPQVHDKVANKNTLNSYLPLRNKGNEFDWSAVVGLVLRSVLRKKIEKYSYEQFVNDCGEAFLEKLGEEEFWPVLQEMYFENKDIFDVSPEFLLFRAQKGEYDKSDERIGTLFTNLLQNDQIESFDSRLNFIEKQVLTVLNQKMTADSSFKAKEMPYMPFISEAFRKDLKFLSHKPKYLLAEIQNFLSLYAFMYCAQLSLAISDWKAGEAPQAKPLYFIMDHEKASSERIHIKNHGYKLFNESAHKLFPMLSMLENLQPGSDLKQPLWKIADNIRSSEVQPAIKEKLQNFAHAFRSQRELNTELTDSDDAIVWVDNIMKLAIAQFADVKTTRGSINNKYVKEIEKYIASGFIQSRGRSGRVLVLNQDYLILLTNIVIGNEDKLRFHELLKEFQQRGVFVDKQTEQELIKFYERIGNVERMSDSGDAVYVRKTV